MTEYRRRLRWMAGAALIAGALSGCGQFRAHQGFVIDPVLADSIVAGIDNRDSVSKTLGRPSFEGQFDDSSWYYVSRNTRQFAFRKPRPADQLVLAVRFDPRGNVSRVERTGLEQVASIHPLGDETPTLGRKTSFFGELFGNIGRVGQGGPAAATADNPNGQ